MEMSKDYPDAFFNQEYWAGLFKITCGVSLCRLIQGSKSWFATPTVVVLWFW